MTTDTVTYDDTRLGARPSRPPMLQRMVTGAAAFDGAMGVACLVAATDFSRWLSISADAVRGTGGVFLVAAVAGAVAAARSVRDVRWIAAANAVFGLWCLGLVAFARPNALGYVLLAGAAVTSGLTAVAELRLGRAKA